MLMELQLALRGGEGEGLAGALGSWLLSVFLPEPRLQAPAGAFSGRCWLSPYPFLLISDSTRLLVQPQGDQPASPLAVRVLFTWGQNPQASRSVESFFYLLVLFLPPRL